MTTLNISLPYINTNVSAPLGNFDKLVINELDTQGGGSYLTQWSSTSTYNIGDYVIYSNQLFRCIQNNTTGAGTVPTFVPTNAWWVQMTSNYPILNDPLYIQVSDATGNDTKAPVAPIPYKTISAAITAAAAGTTIKLVDNSSQFIENITLSGKTNITIDGGLSGVYDDGGNSIVSTAGTCITITGCSGITIKNLIIDTSGNATGKTVQITNSSDVVFDNVVFSTPITTTADFEINSSGALPGGTFGDIILVGCRSLSSTTTQYLNVSLVATAGALTSLSRLFLINHLGPLSLGDNNLNGSSINYDNLNVYIYNCRNYFADNATHHVGGSYQINDTLISSDLVSTATNASTNSKLIISGGTLRNVSTGVYYFINKTGNCPYRLTDFDYSTDAVTSLTGSPTASQNVNWTSGPAKTYNRIATVNAAASSVNATAGTATQLVLGTVASDPFSLISIATNVLTINEKGTYGISLMLEVSTTSTLADAARCNVWIGGSGSTESTAGVVNAGFTAPLTSAGGPATLNIGPVRFNITKATFPAATYYIYIRNLGPTAFTVKQIATTITQLR